MSLRSQWLSAVVCSAASLLAPAYSAAQNPTPQSPTSTTAPAPPPAAVVPTPTPAAVQQMPAPGETINSPAQDASTSTIVAQVSGTKIHGTITDPDGYPIPGATVMLTPTKGAARKATSSGDGSYSLSVTPGSYTLVVSMKGFSSYSVTGLKIAAVTSMTLDAKLAVGQATQVVNVEASAAQVSVDSDSNASSLVLSGKDLDALSDDPDELSSELTALAGPSAGPNGGQIYVDGFTGGQLPPKSSIREIRINQNPFSAQYDRLGFGRIEVFTKPGTDKFHGSFQMNGNASQFNTGNPLIPSTTYQAPYHTIFMFGSITGPINKWSSFSIGGSHRAIQDLGITNATILGATAASTTPCVPGDITCTSRQLFLSTLQPQARTDLTPRIDIAIGQNNVLTLRYQFYENDKINQGVTGLALPTTGYNSFAQENQIQVSDTQTISPRIINETRFEWERARTNTIPLSNAASVSVQGAFSSGGYSSQFTSDHQDHMEVQNYTSIQTKKNFIRLGGRLRTTREATDTTANTNGSFTYASLTATGSGTDNSYATGTPSQFSRTVINTPNTSFTLADVGVYAETDWKPINNLTVTYGFRFEAQNHLQEHHDFAPRIAFAYGIGGPKKTPKTVIRGGFGIFFDRFSQGDVLTTIQQNGVNQIVTTLRNPTNCTAALPISSTNCAATGTTGATMYSTAGNLRAPYVEQFALGADRQLGRIGTMSVNYIHTLGVHQLALQNSLCGLSGGTCSNTTAVNNQFFSGGQFHQNQLMVNGRVQTAKWLSLFGFYSMSFANGNTSGAGSFVSTPGNINADLGRTSFDIRSRAFVGGSITLPKYILISPFMIAQSGSPFNITEGRDVNLDGQFNDRPLLVPNGTANSVSIPGCGSFLSHSAANAASFSQLVPTYACSGPAQFVMNLRATKTFGFGGSRNKQQEQQGQQGDRDRVVLVAAVMAATVVAVVTAVAPASSAAAEPAPVSSIT